jgi:hypothetical protein
MTVARTATAEQVGRYLASLLRGSEDVSDLFVLQSRSLVEAWLIVSSESIDAEVGMHSCQRRLLERFPDQDVDLRIFEASRLGATGAASIVPHNAIQIEI